MLRSPRPRTLDRRWAQIASGIGCVLALICAACAPERPKIVVWIEVDTLRADALGCYGNSVVGENGEAVSPHIDALAADGVRFERAYTPAPWTIPSLVSQLSGRWPWEHGVMRLTSTCSPEDAPLVPLLASCGLSTAGVMTNFITTSKIGIARGFERWDDSFATGHEGSTARAAVARLLTFLDEARRAGDEPVFLFAWLFDPHYRYEEHEGLRFGPGFGAQTSTPYTGSLRGDEDLNELLKRRAELSPADIEFLRGRYASEVAWVDRAVGDLVQGLKDRGLFDDALIVFNADHGEEIMDRGWIGHTVSLHEELVRVPWIVRFPKSPGSPDSMRSAPRGRVIEHAVSLIDLPATLVELATGKSADGDLSHSRSLAPVMLEAAVPERRWLYLHTDFEPMLDTGVKDEKRARQWGVVDAERGLKWIVDHKVAPGETPRTYLFDLTRDPRETENLATTPGGLESARSMQRLRGLVPEPLDGRRGAPRVLAEEPWIRASGDDDGAGPALTRGR
jgi:choline-sulfatase